MKAGMDSLLALMRAQSFGQLSGPDWNDLFALAEEERVLPWAAFRLRQRMPELPAAIAERVAEIEREEAKAAFFWRAELRDVLRAFKEKSIPVAPLKGPLLAERIYGGAALRPCRDLDLLIAKSDWLRAEEALLETGFRPMRMMDDYHRPWMRQSTQLELHYDGENPLAFDFHVAQALKQATRGEFLGEPCLLLAPEDELLYLCLHAARHGYERLCLVLDLRLAFERPARDKWRPRAEVEEMNGLLALGLAMARMLAPGLRDGWDPGLGDKEWKHLQTIANGLWLRLTTERRAAMDWRAAHAFYLELEPTRWRRFRRRVRHGRILSTRTIDRDRIFAARFGLTRSWQIRMLRPLRLLMECRLNP